MIYRRKDTFFFDSRVTIPRRHGSCLGAHNTRAATIFLRTIHPGVNTPGYQARQTYGLPCTIPPHRGGTLNVIPIILQLVPHR